MPQALVAPVASATPSSAGGATASPPPPLGSPPPPPPTAEPAADPYAQHDAALAAAAALAYAPAAASNLPSPLPPAPPPPPDAALGTALALQVQTSANTASPSDSFKAAQVIADAPLSAVTSAPASPGGPSIAAEVLDVIVRFKRQSSTEQGHTPPAYLHCKLSSSPEPDLSTTEVDTIPALAKGAILVTMEDVTHAEMSKLLVRRRYEFSYNAKLPDDKVAALFAPSMVFNVAGTRLPMRPSEEGSERTGLEAYLERRRCLVQAFPDMHYRLLEQTCKSDGRVFTSWQWLGTHLGPYIVKDYDGHFSTIPASGNKVSMHGVAVDVCVETAVTRLIVDHAAYYDEASLRMQLTLAANDGDEIRQRVGDRRRLQLRTSPAPNGDSDVVVQLYLSVLPPPADLGSSADSVFTRVSASPRVGVRVGVGGAINYSSADATGALRPGSGVAVQAALRVTISTAPRQTEAERETMVMMDDYYAAKAMRQLAAFEGDGFALCDSSVAADLPRIILASHAFASVLGLPGAAVLKAPLLEVLYAPTKDSQPNLVVEVREAIAKGVACQKLIDGRRPALTATGRVLDRRAHQRARESCVLLLQIAPFFEDSRQYWAVMLSELNDSLSRPPTGIGVSSQLRIQLLMAKSRQDRASRDGEDGGASRVQLAASKASSPLSSCFYEAVPRSWTWFECNQVS